MKKSQLRNIIRGIIREQLDVEKNKLRPIKPEIPGPPAGGSTPNSHMEVYIEVCDCSGNHSWCQNNQNSFPLTFPMNTWASWKGWTCNGQMCQNTDIYTNSGEVFEVSLYGGTLNWTYKLLSFSQPTDAYLFNNGISSTVGCPILITSGCMDPNATNYDSNASTNDCVCTYGPPQEGVIQPGGSNNKCADPNADNYASNAQYDCNGCYLTTTGDGSSGPMDSGWDSCCTYGEIEYGYQCSNVGPCAMRSLDPNHPLAYDPFNPQYGAMSSFPYVNPCGQGQQSDPGCYYGGGSSMQNLNDATEACTATAISNGWDIQDQATQPSSCPTTGAWAYPYDGTNVHPL